ncbi:helix-turn-helix transcriptional regulator [Candidatus Woesearchaeota archaeon]|nr:helix-turn-helix transcriptional regulator [Candidatus Woesearchaeota archaeon]
MVIKVTDNALQAFLAKPKEKLHLADISRKIKVPHPTARQWLNKLEKAGVLLKEHKGRLTLYSLKMEGPNIIDYLAIAEKQELIKKCNESLIIKELASELHKSLPENTKAIIFGSAAESPAKAQDIDLLVTGTADEKAIRALGKKLNKEIHLIAVKSLSQVTKALKEEIIKKHIIIRGTEDILRWMIWQA